MGKKRSAEEKRLHLLMKLQKLEDKMKDGVENASEASSNVQLHTDPPVAVEQNLSQENSGDDDALIEMDIAGEVTIPPEDIDETILAILGDAPNTDPKGQILHKQVAERWIEVLKKGIKKEEKDEILKENPVFSNCEVMLPPKLNPEVSAALTEVARRRDNIIEKRQQQISTVLSCLGTALQLSFKEDIQDHKLQIIKKLNEACRLLCDSLYLDTKGRRSLVLSVINKEMKEFLVQAEPHKFLFGENLTEKIKTAKSVQRSGSDLKIPEYNKKFTGNKQYNTPTRKNSATTRALNWRGPPRPDTRAPGLAAGGPAYNNRRFQPYQGQRKREEKPYQRTRK